MHELSVAKNIIRIAREHLSPDEELRLTRINVHVGTFSTVVPELLQSGFEAATDGTPLAKTKLNITTIPLCIRCSSCGKEVEIEPIEFACPYCNSTDVEIVSGNELYIADLEISETLNPSLS